MLEKSLQDKQVCLDILCYYYIWSVDCKHQLLRVRDYWIPFVFIFFLCIFGLPGILFIYKTRYTPVYQNHKSINSRRTRESSQPGSFSAASAPSGDCGRDLLTWPRAFSPLSTAEGTNDEERVKNQRHYKNKTGEQK